MTHLNDLFARLWRTLLWLVIASLCAWRFSGLAADFPNHSQWVLDQAKFTDEGWWGGAAVMYHLTGQWFVAGDYNPATAVPVWPILLAALFHWTGVSILAARALNVAISIANVALVYLVVRRQVAPESQLPPLMAALLLAASPFAFVYSHLAVLDTFITFQFCLCLLLASRASKHRLVSLAIIALIATCMLLTKTTALVLLPAIACMLLLSLPRSIANALRVAVAVGLIPALLVALVHQLIVKLGFGPDYSYFFNVNAAEDLDWSQTFAMIGHLAWDCLWVDRILYPAALASLVISILWLRRLWRNPLFVASWVAIAGQLAFLFRLQDSYAPRHFMALLVPILFILAVTLAEIGMRSQRGYLAAAALLAVAAIVNVTTLVSLARHRTYDFYDAANSIQGIVARESHRNRMLLGVSAGQLGLMTGLPSINDVYGTQDLPGKVRRYDPEWFIAWNGIGDDDRNALAQYRIERVSSYEVFDDSERDILILYHLIPK